MDSRIALSCGQTPLNSRVRASPRLLVLASWGALVTYAPMSGCTEGHPSQSSSAVWSLELELELPRDEEGVVQLSDIRGLAVDGASRIYVLDSQEQVVIVFDSTGFLIRRVGGRGDGPGEFRGANGIVVDLSDRLWVYDPRVDRITVFDSTGDIAETKRFPIRSHGFRWAGGVDTLGRLYDEQIQVVEQTGTVVRHVRRADFRTGDIDTLVWPNCGAERPQAFRYPHGYMQVPFGAGEYVAFDARGVLWCADTREVRVYEYLLGDTVPRRVLVQAGEPAPVSTRERDSVIDLATSFMQYGGATKLDFSLIPSIKPMIESITMDDSGRVWVRTRTKDELAALVFSRTGSVIAKVHLPRESIWWLPPVLRDGRLYTVNLDSLDVPVVARYWIYRPDISPGR